MNREERIREFVTEIWSWYGFHKRKLPWRDLAISDPTQRAYCILVSEVMLQQTQVPRVTGTFRSFMELFPRLEDLANADTQKVLLAWRGMGYNSRALRLRDAAQAIANGEWRITDTAKSLPVRQAGAIRHPQSFPQNMEELMAIPGIGHYTAAAIRNFAFGIPTPCLDTNIRRVLHRTFIGPENADGTWKKDDTYLLKLAEEVLAIAISLSPRSLRSPPPSPGGGGGHGGERATADWHAALMDFGSLVCTKRNPRWLICPLTRRGISKTTKKNFELRIAKSVIRHPKSEPGRLVGSTFIPNRIFRGRIVETLRDAPTGLRPLDIGPRISVDWESTLHAEWLDGLLEKLVADRLLRKSRGRFVLG